MAKPSCARLNRLLSKVARSYEELVVPGPNPSIRIKDHPRYHCARLTTRNGDSTDSTMFITKNDYDDCPWIEGHIWRTPMSLTKHVVILSSRCSLPCAPAPSKSKSTMWLIPNTNSVQWGFLCQCLQPCHHQSGTLQLLLGKIDSSGYGHKGPVEPSPTEAGLELCEFDLNWVICIYIYVYIYSFIIRICIYI